MEPKTALNEPSNRQNTPISRDRMSRVPSQPIAANGLRDADVRSMSESGRISKAVAVTRSVTPRLLRIKAGARYLSVRPEKLRQLIRGGKIPRILDRDADPERTPWRVDRLDLDRWIERNRETLDFA